MKVMVYLILHTFLFQDSIDKFVDPIHQRATQLQRVFYIINSHKPKYLNLKSSRELWLTVGKQGF